MVVDGGKDEDNDEGKEGVVEDVVNAWVLAKDGTTSGEVIAAPVLKGVEKSPLVKLNK